MKIVERDVNDLIEAEYNPRQMTAEQRGALLDSLKRFGMVDPVIVNKHKDRKDIVIGGHQRLRIWKSLGEEKIPTVEVELDRDKERELNIRLNKNVGEWDWDALANEFDLDELEGWGFDEGELIGEDPEGGGEGSEENIHPDLERMELQPFEHYDYILVLAEDVRDWEALCEVFKLKKVISKQHKGNTKIGLGRCIKASRLLEVLND